MVTFKLRRGTASLWTERNPILADGEPGYETDTGKLKMGDGETAWSSLAYLIATPAAHATSHESGGSDPVTANLADVTGTLAVANGGTGATSASAARTSLDIAYQTIKANSGAALPRQPVINFTGATVTATDGAGETIVDVIVPAVPAATTASQGIIELATNGENAANVVVQGNDTRLANDGDKGDIVVTATGATWMLDSSVVTTAAKTVTDDATVAAMVNTLGGAAATGTAGTGLVYSTSPALVTPALGTPTSGDIKNCTGLVVAGGGTGRATSTTAYGLIAAGTTATGAHQTLPTGATNQVLIGGGASALPAWTTRTGLWVGLASMSGSVTWTNMPAAHTIFMDGLGQSAYVKGADLTGYTQCRVRVIQGAAAFAGSRLRLRYSTTFSTSAASYSAIGTSEVDVALTTTGTTGPITSAWTDLVAGAKADVFLACTGIDGNGVADPTFLSIVAEFR